MKKARGLAGWSAVLLLAYCGGDHEPSSGVAAQAAMPEIAREYYVAPDGDDLLAGSPAIDAAIEEDEIDLDLEGAPRPQGSGHDIGAYEFRGP